MEFFNYDSRGGKIDRKNPILVGKRWHGWNGDMLKESYFSGEWPGGIAIYGDYVINREPCARRSLIEWFGLKVVERWEQSYNETGL